MRYVLGLDCSTTMLGYSLLSIKDGEIVSVGSIDISELETLAEKVSRVISFLDGFVQWEVTAIGLEEPLAAFKAGFSSAQTISKLQQLSGALRFAIFQKADKEPTLVSARSARSKLGIKTSSGKTKEAVIAWATASGVKFQTRSILKGKNAGTVCWLAGTDDAADAFVVAKYILNIVRK